MDVHITKDGVIVLMHDGTVTRTTGKAGDVEDFTYGELDGLEAACNRKPNDPEIMKKYFGRGIDGTDTDRPDILKKVLAGI